MSKLTYHMKIKSFGVIGALIVIIIIAVFVSRGFYIKNFNESLGEVKHVNNPSQSQLKSLNFEIFEPSDANGLQAIRDWRISTFDGTSIATIEYSSANSPEGILLLSIEEGRAKGSNQDLSMTSDTDYDVRRIDISGIPALVVTRKTALPIPAEKVNNDPRQDIRLILVRDNTVITLLSLDKMIFPLSDLQRVASSLKAKQ